MMRIAVVTPIPTPYRDPFWNVVAAQPGIVLDVFYCSEGKADRPWQSNWKRDYRSEILPGVNLLKGRGADASCFWNRTIATRIREGRYDALIVGGYNHATMLAAMWTARRSGIPYYLMCESYLRPRPVLRQAVKQWLVRTVVKGAAGGFPTGRRARAYLEHYGAKPDSLVEVPNAPDVETIQSEVLRRLPERAALRRSLGLDERVTFLFIGRLIPKKRGLLVIEALAEAGLRGKAQLLVVGDGPDLEKMRAEASRTGFGEDVKFAGFVQPAAVRDYYLAADCFILPSSETWGVVVAEALAAGLPVIVSDEVGCHPDVVNESVGLIVRAGSRVSLAAAMERMAATRPSRHEVMDAWARVFEWMCHRAVANRMIGCIQDGAGVRAKSVQTAGADVSPE